MFCNQCGTKNSENAVFCEKCGNRFGESEEELTVVSGGSQKASDDQDEQIITSLRPTLLFVKVGYVLAVLGGLLLAVLLALLGVLFSYPLVSSGAVVVLGLSLLLIPGYYHIRQKMIRYTLTDSKIEIDEGLFNKTTRNVPLRIIQDVTVSANVFQRMLGFGNVEVENANEADDPVVLSNINAPREFADQLLHQMRLLNK